MGDSTPDLLDALQQWYDRQTDGDWEHSWGVKIGTLDNPGWSVKVNLEGTDLEDRPFAEVAELEPEREWIHCRVVDCRFEGFGGPLMLDRILRGFVDWAMSGT
ncbi:MAG TPA: immunity 53 family protein [Longimicrobiaceae bacterium]|nr:immunity 53 family protein [Longimicrobiaceae bacterium]